MKLLNKKKRLCFYLVALYLFMFLTTSCKTNNDQYYWGEYEDLLYKSFKQDKDSEPIIQVQKLTEDISKAQANGKQVPPGVYAHLGYMQHLEGDDAAAVKSLRTEELLYPSSKKFMDRLINSLTKTQKKSVEARK